MGGVRGKNLWTSISFLEKLGFVKICATIPGVECMFVAVSSSMI